MSTSDLSDLFLSPGSSDNSRERERGEADPTQPPSSPPSARKIDKRRDTVEHTTKDSAIELNEQLQGEDSPLTFPPEFLGKVPALEEFHIPPTDEDLRNDPSFVPFATRYGRIIVDQKNFEKRWTRNNYGALVLIHNPGGFIDCKECKRVAYQTAFVNPKQPLISPDKTTLPPTIRPYKPSGSNKTGYPPKFEQPRQAPKKPKGKKPFSPAEGHHSNSQESISSPLPPKPPSAISLSSILSAPNTPEEHKAEWEAKKAQMIAARESGSSKETESVISKVTSAKSSIGQLPMDYNHFGQTELVHRGYIKPSMLPNLNKSLHPNPAQRPRPSQPRPTKRDPICDECQKVLAKRIVNVERCSKEYCNPTSSNLHQKKSGIFGKLRRPSDVSAEKSQGNKFRPGNSGGLSNKVSNWGRAIKASFKSKDKDGGITTRKHSNSSHTQAHCNPEDDIAEFLKSNRPRGATNTTTGSGFPCENYPTITSIETEGSNPFITNTSSRTTDSESDTIFARCERIKAEVYKHCGNPKFKPNISDSERQRQMLEEQIAMQQKRQEAEQEKECWGCGGVLWGVCPDLVGHPAGDLCGGCSPFVNPSSENIFGPRIKRDGTEETREEVRARLIHMRFANGQYYTTDESLDKDVSEPQSHHHQFSCENDDEGTIHPGNCDYQGHEAIYQGDYQYQGVHYDDVISGENDYKHDSRNPFEQRQYEIGPQQSSSTIVGDSDETVIAGVDKTYID